MTYATEYYGTNIFVPVGSDSSSIESPLIIGDDWLTANGRAFAFDIDPTGLGDVADAIAFFGASSVVGDSFNVEGSVSEVVVSGVVKWRVVFELNSVDTIGFSPGVFNWTMEVRIDGKRATRLHGCFEMIARQTA